MRTFDLKHRIVPASLVAMLGLGIASQAAADPYWRGHRCQTPYYAPPVANHYYYPPQPQVVYVQAPPVVVHAPPVVQEVHHVYTAPAPVYSGAYVQNTYGQGYYGAPRGNRVLSSAVLGAAGGFLGSQVGSGSGRAAATAAGAVAGWLLGGNLAY